MPMNFSHVNIGMPGTGKKVDQWHLDSVGYVLVIMMSDTKDMVGGELQVLTRDRDDNALEILNSQTDSYTPEEIISVNYASAGRGIFMQGSHIFHQVTSVVSSPRPRISLVVIFFNSRVKFSKAQYDILPYREVYFLFFSTCSLSRDYIESSPEGLSLHVIHHPSTD